jgi:hypothetical protein
MALFDADRKRLMTRRDKTCPKNAGTVSGDSSDLIKI